MESTYKITVLGIQPDRDPKEVRDQLRPMLTNDDAAFDKIFHAITHEKPIILTAGIPQINAENLAELLTAIGLECRLDPMTLTLLPIDDKPRAIYRCPACGHYQPIEEDHQPDICQRCGIVGSHYEVISARISEKISNRNPVTDPQSKKNQTTTPQRRSIFPILGLLGMTALALIGIGSLLWPPADTPDADPVTAAPPRLPLTTAPPTPSAGGPAPASPAAGPPVPPTAAAPPASGALQTSGVAPPTPGRPGGPSIETAAAPPAAPADRGTADAPSPAVPAAPAPERPSALLDAGRLPAAPPPDDPASATIANPVAHDPQLLAKLARYQLQTGDLTAATHTITRAIALLGAQRHELNLRQAEAFMRVQVEIQAEIARQHHRRQDPTTAQAYWLEAAKLANLITTPGERAPAFSGLARMMNDGEPKSAGNYFNRAIEITRLIEEPFDQAVARGMIARDLARTKRPEQAQTLFDQAAAAVAAVPDPESRRVARTILAKHLAEAGDGAAAGALLAQVTEEKEHRTVPELSQHHAEALGALALNQANEPDQTMTRADFAAALEQIQTLTDPTLRAGTLLYLARAVAAAGDLETAAQLAAAAGSWD
jgi:tetratricopeptide (TPR) repeat protein